MQLQRHSFILDVEYVNSVKNDNFWWTHFA